MAFFIQLRSSNHVRLDGDTPDPRTGWGMPSYRDLGLSAPERQAVVALLQRLGGRRPGVDDRVHLTLTDSSLAEVHLRGLYGAGPCVNGHLAAEAVSMPLLHVAVELARAGRLILTPDGFPRPLVIDEPLRQSLSTRYPQVQSGYSAAMIWNLLRPRDLDPPAGEGESTE
jgi:hypothetical protein